MGRSYLVIEMKTAAMDGFYTNRDEAEGVREYLRESHPWGEWLVTEIDWSHNAPAYLYDAWFHLNRLRSLDDAGRIWMPTSERDRTTA